MPPLVKTAPPLAALLPLMLQPANQAVAPVSRKAAPPAEDRAELAASEQAPGWLPSAKSLASLER